MKNRFLLMVLVILASAGLVMAQETTTGSIGGQVLDDQNAAVPGAQVTITSGQGSKTIITDENGRFFAPYLTPGQYSVTVELSGFSTIVQEGIQVRLGQRIELKNLTLKVGELSERLEVVGTPPVIDTSNTTVGGILATDQLQKLPVGRNFTATLYMVPGVSDSSGVGNANPSIGGASGLENNYVVDGVNISNAGFGGVGVYTIVFGSLGTGVTTDFIQETQVKTAGFEAEYGQATGGVVNVVTKSGSNELHGSVFGYWSPPALQGEFKQLETPNGTINTKETETSDFGLSVGGPLMKDKLFFFGTFNPQFQRRAAKAPEDFPLESLGWVDRKRKSYSYAAKVTYQATANHRFDVSVFGDPSKGDEGPQRLGALLRDETTAYSSLDYGTNNQTLRYDGVLSPNWLIEASVARSNQKLEETPSVNEYQQIDRTVSPNRRLGGIGYYDRSQEGTNIQYSLKSTNLFEAAGSHSLRYGVQFEDIEYQRDANRTGTPFTLPDGTQTRTGASFFVLPDPAVGEFSRVVRANFGDPPLTTQSYLNWFVQDTWQVNSSLTLKLGVRWEKQTLEGGTPICFSDESQVGAGDGTPGNEISCKYSWSNNWSPRLGFIWDPSGTGKSKVYANYGRFYVKIPNDLADRALAADAGVSRADYYDRGLTQPIPDGVDVGGTTRHYIPAGLHPALFANDTKSTYTDEFLAGVEYEIAPSFSLGVRYINRNISTVLEDYAQASPVMYDLGYPGLGSVEYIIDNIGADLVTLNPGTEPGFENVKQPFFEKPEHKYNSIEITATKSFSDNWSLLASYRWSKLDGNFEGFYRSDNGQSDPAITSLFDFPTNDPSYTEVGVPQFGYGGDIRYQGVTLGTGRLPNDRTHQFKIYGNYQIGNLNLGMALNAGSGRILTALASNPTYTNAGEIPLSLRGGGIDSVDGMVENTKFETVVDLHADYAIRLGDGGQRFVLIADAFNVLNNRDPRWYDVDVDSGFGAPNTNYGQPLFGGNGGTPSYAAPFRIRLGARIEF